MAIPKCWWLGRDQGRCEGWGLGQPWALWAPGTTGGGPGMAPGTAGGWFEAQQGEAQGRLQGRCPSCPSCPCPSTGPRRLRADSRQPGRNDQPAVAVACEGPSPSHGQLGLKREWRAERDVPVGVSWGCHCKVPRTGRPRTTEVCCLTAAKSRSLESVGCTPSAGAKEGVPGPSPASGSFLLVAVKLQSSHVFPVCFSV